LPGGFEDARIASGQIVRISSARGESSGQARDRTMAPIACAMVSMAFARTQLVHPSLFDLIVHLRLPTPPYLDVNRNQNIDFLDDVHHYWNPFHL